MCKSSRPEVFCKKDVLRTSQNLQENTRVYSDRPKACDLVKKETPAQVFFCEFCEIFKNTFFYRTPPVAASVCDAMTNIFLLFKTSEMITISTIN